MRSDKKAGAKATKPECSLGDEVASRFRNEVGCRCGDDVDEDGREVQVTAVPAVPEGRVCYPAFFIAHFQARPLASPPTSMNEARHRRRERVVVGMSGGVDSSVAAWLLKQQGYDVVGVFMKNWEDDDTDEYCTSREDLVDAAAVADVIGIDLEAVNFVRRISRARVRAVPARLCRRAARPIRTCCATARSSSAPFSTTRWRSARHGSRPAITRACGARARAGETTELLKAADASKDQTYFLHRLTQEQLAPVLFPLGGMTKRDVRAIAQREGIPTYAKRDSTGICFIGERPFRDFLARYLPRTPGPIVTAEGATVGRHDGLAYYTIGQRQGLRVGGTRGGAPAPWFVAAKDLARNALIAVQGHEHPLLHRCEVDAADMHWIAGARTLAAGAARREDALPDAGCGVRGRRRSGRRDRRDVRRAAVGADAGPVPGALRRRALPRRRRDRCARMKTLIVFDFGSLPTAKRSPTRHSRSSWRASACRAAGNTGTAHAERLRSAGADYIAHTYDDVAEITRRLTGNR